MGKYHVYRKFKRQTKTKFDKSYDTKRAANQRVVHWHNKGVDAWLDEDPALWE